MFFFILLLFYFVIRDEFEFDDLKYLCVNFRIKVNSLISKNLPQNKFNFSYNIYLFKFINFESFYLKLF